MTGKRLLIRGLQDYGLPPIKIEGSVATDGPQRGAAHQVLGVVVRLSIACCGPYSAESTGAGVPIKVLREAARFSSRRRSNSSRSASLASGYTRAISTAFALSLLARARARASLLLSSSPWLCPEPVRQPREAPSRTLAEPPTLPSRLTPSRQRPGAGNHMSRRDNSKCERWLSGPSMSPSACRRAAERREFADPTSGDTPPLSGATPPEMRAALRPHGGRRRASFPADGGNQLGVLHSASAGDERPPKCRIRLISLPVEKGP